MILGIASCAAMLIGVAGMAVWAVRFCHTQRAATEQSLIKIRHIERAMRGESVFANVRLLDFYEEDSLLCDTLSKLGRDAANCALFALLYLAGITVSRAVF